MRNVVALPRLFVSDFWIVHFLMLCRPEKDRKNSNQVALHCILNYKNIHTFLVAFSSTILLTLISSFPDRQMNWVNLQSISLSLQINLHKLFWCWWTIRGSFFFILWIISLNSLCSRFMGLASVPRSSSPQHSIKQNWPLKR